MAYIDNERWIGVPFVLKAGKGEVVQVGLNTAIFADTVVALNKSKTEIIINFKHSTNANIFNDLAPNQIKINVQPDEGVFLKINSMVPSLETKSDAIDLDLTYRGREIPEAYEALLLDALRRDRSRSVRGDELDASWRIFTPLLHWLDENEDVEPRDYPYGSIGPEGLEEFVASYQG